MFRASTLLTDSTHKRSFISCLASFASFSLGVYQLPTRSVTLHPFLFCLIHSPVHGQVKLSHFLKTVWSLLLIYFFVARRRFRPVSYNDYKSKLNDSYIFLVCMQSIDTTFYFDLSTQSNVFEFHVIISSHFYKYLQFRLIYPSLSH